MSLWDRVTAVFGKRQRPPQGSLPSRRTWRLTWRGGTLALVAPHGTFPVKRIAESVHLASIPDGTELVCEGDYEGGATISELVVTSAVPATPLERLPRARAKPAEPTLPVSHARLRAALDELVSTRWCEGELDPRELAITIDGETAKPAGVAWLVARAEPAPFGRDGETILDAKVRSALRVRARGSATIGGLDIGEIVAHVEDAFATDVHLEATLLDILVYEPGGKFVRHKDTPRDPRQLGTLLVEVPVPHRGGELVLVEGDAEHRIAWGEWASGSRWVAFYGDVDHTVEAVETGTRVTLAYTLRTTDRPRTDATLAAHLDTIADATIALLSDPARPASGTLVVPCERLVVASNERTEPLTRAMLRGSDVAIARTFERCGIAVEVIEVLLATSDEEPRAFSRSDGSVYRVARPIPSSVLADCEALSLNDTIDIEDEDEDPVHTTSIESYVELTDLDVREWIVRRAAGAKLIYEGLYSETGYFGNEACDGLVYVAAALLLRLPER